MTENVEKCIQVNKKLTGIEEEYINHLKFYESINIRVSIYK